MGFWEHFFSNVFFWRYLHRCQLHHHCPYPQLQTNLYNPNLWGHNPLNRHHCGHHCCHCIRRHDQRHCLCRNRWNCSCCLHHRLIRHFICCLSCSFCRCCSHLPNCLPNRLLSHRHSCLHSQRHIRRLSCTRYLFGYRLPRRPFSYCRSQHCTGRFSYLQKFIHHPNP